MVYIIVHCKNGARLCQDGLIREFANLGSTTSCVKVYRRVGAATACVDKLNRGQSGTFRVVPLDNIDMDATGILWRDENISLGHVSQFH